MDTRLLDILVCPLCKGRLYPDRKAGELICRGDQLAFPIKDGIPIMLEQAARKLSDSSSEAGNEPAKRA